MSYTLESFCRDCRQVLKADPSRKGRERVRSLLEELLADKDFVAQYVTPMPPGRHTLYEDPELGFCVLSHVNARAGKSPPHDHGASWAVYGQAVAYTDMTEWRRTDGGQNDRPGPATVEVARRYRLEPGRAGLYDVRDIHAIDYPDGARFVRVTGTDLDHVPRLKFDLAKGEAQIIESATTGPG